MAMDIDPRLREQPQTAHQPFSILPPPSSYSHSPIRLPLPQQQQQQQQQQQHHSALPSWSPGNLPYYSVRPESQLNSLVSTDVPSHHANPFEPLQHGGGFQSSESKRPRACEACRGLKVKCDPDAIKGSCRRCAKARRPCIVTAPSRKRQKKSENRVAELEKKINALEASLHATRCEASSGSDDAASDEDEVDDSKINPGAPHGRTGTKAARDHEVEHAGKYPPRRRHLEHIARPRRRDPGNLPQADGRKRRLSEYREEELRFMIPEGKGSPMKNDALSKRPLTKVTELANTHPLLLVDNAKSGPFSNKLADATAPFHEYADIIDRKIVDAITATYIFEYYKKNMAAHMPVVVFSSDVTAGTIRKTKPILFLAILSIASAHDYSHLQGVLTREVMRVYADRLICKREKSLELIQALQVSTIWYSTDANFYQLIHLAAVMGIELGISSHARGKKERFLELWRDDSRIKPDLEGKDSLDAKRAWLGCYFLCANAAMGSRRMNLTRWTSYLDECLHDLETSEDALPSDKTFCQWVKLQRLADDLGTQISTEEISHAGIADPKIHYALKSFERQLTDWRKQKPTEVTSPTLQLGFHVINLYMHDFAMPIDSGLENFKATGDQPTASKQKSHPEVLTTAHVGVLTTCLTSVHGIFDSFLALEAQEIRTLPIFHFARLARASVLLLRMYFAATTPNSELGKVISGDHMKVGHYICRLIDLLRDAARDGKCDPAHKLSIVLAMMQVQFERSKDGKKTGLVDEIEVNSKLEARPVDAEERYYSSKPSYKKLQLEGSNSQPMHPSPPKQPTQPPPPPTLAQQPPGPLPSMMGDRALQVLSEVVAMSSDPAAADCHLTISAHHDNRPEGWYGYTAAASASGGTIMESGTAPPPVYNNNPSSEYYHVSMGVAGGGGGGGGLDSTTSNHDHEMLNGVHDHHPHHPAGGFEHAMGITFGEEAGVYLNIMDDDDGFYQIMQGTNSLFGDLG